LDTKRRWVDNITLELKEITVRLDHENNLFALKIFLKILTDA